MRRILQQSARDSLTRWTAQTWRRLTPPGAPTWAFRLEEARGARGAAPAGAARRGLLLGAGEFFFLALGRRGPPPAGGGTLAQRLEALLSGGGGGAQGALALHPETVCRAEELLGLELSFGRRGGAGGAVVEASTLPARVGAVVLSPEATPARLAQLATRGQAEGFGHADSCEFLLEPVEQ